MFTSNNAKCTSSATSEISISKFSTPDVMYDATMLEDLENRLSVRFFLKRSKKFHYDSFGRDLIKKRETRENRRIPRKYKDEKRTLGIGGDCVQASDILCYLKRFSVRAEARRIMLIKKQKLEEPKKFEFSKPKSFACHKCPKVLFHKLTYRRHMIFHMSHTQHCKKCKKAFAIKSDRRKHEAVCSKRQTKCTRV